MHKVLLLTTVGCHLCDNARAELHAAAVDIRVTEFDIACDDQMIERYGEKIPVIKTDDGRELQWPFSSADILKLFGSAG
ncbi:glutaredoxin family protein [Gilvimarinus sp. DA14]|uniref:glutaredoxin family protein n=1 Tax=Gilvimarinus sp. DA14 TaxID=2956798 RepID=UPI0020B6985F|nr:glutaredoxin family protein [Gilvimarinus sp. DA14]UTF60953.1 glutaredoxin family protein [Gilvimarinus sp. DA14]